MCAHWCWGQAYGLPIPLEMVIGGMVPVVGIGMWTVIHKSKGALMLMHGSKTPKLPKGADTGGH